MKEIYPRTYSGVSIAGTVAVYVEPNRDKSRLFWYEARALANDFEEGEAIGFHTNRATVECVVYLSGRYGPDVECLVQTDEQAIQFIEYLEHEVGAEELP